MSTPPSRTKPAQQRRRNTNTLSMPLAFIVMTSVLTVIHLRGNKEALESVSPFLESASIQFQRKKIQHFGVYASAGELIEILQGVGGLGLAGVLISWINARSKRYIHITTKDNKVETILQGYSENQAHRLIEHAREINIAEVPNSDKQT